jgi:hypothetical protein
MPEPEIEQTTLSDTVHSSRFTVFLVNLSIRMPVSQGLPPPRHWRMGSEGIASTARGAAREEPKLVGCCASKAVPPRHHTHVSTSMGVGGLLIWLKEAFPEAFTQPEKGRSHLLIDANSQVHDAIRNARGARETEVVRRFVSSVDQLVQQYQPSRGLSVALDGPAPLAKLETQRQRRLKKKASGARTAGVSGNAVTPGTSFMALIDEALMQWADARTCHGLPCSVLIDPTVRAGEGEGEG